MIIIREAEISDIEIIADFQVAMALETENLVLDRQNIMGGIKTIFNDPSKGQYYIAQGVNKERIGCLLTTYEWSDWRNRTIYWIQSVFVVKQYRKMGVYKSLYSYVKNKVNSNDSLAGIRLYVDQSNTNAQQVYEKLGMDGSHYQLFEWMK